MEATITKEDVVKFIESMTVLELSEMVKELEEKFGVSAAAAAMPVMAGGASAVEAPKEEEKTEFNVILVAVGDKKIQVIKEVRAVTNLGLKEAKDLVDGAPMPVKEGIPMNEAENIKKQLEAAGATVEIK